MPAFRAFAALAVVAVVCSAPVAAQQVKPGGNETITIRGFVSGSLFLQDANFGTGNGQRAQYVTQELKDWWHGGDIRSTRLTVLLDMPAVVRDWKPTGNVELDLFGAFAATPPFGGSQPQPRLRTAWVEMSNGRTAFRVGQDWSLTQGNIPVSTSHLGFPMGWGSGGFIGFRFPGMWWTQQLTPTAATTTASVRLAVMKNTWTGANAENPTAGEAGLPQFEGRLDFKGKAGTAPWSLYLVGHYDRKNLLGARPATAPDTVSSNLDGWAAEAGARIDAGRLTLMGNAYRARALGQQFASIVQLADIKGWGAWGQAGLVLSPNWSVWGYYGTDDPADDDVRRAFGPGGRLTSRLLVPMLRFNAGPYNLGLEWLHSRVKTATTALPATGTDVLNGNQVIFSVLLNY